MNCVSVHHFLRISSGRWLVFLLAIGFLGVPALAQDKPPTQSKPPVMPEPLPKTVAEGTTPEGRMFREYLKTQKARFAYARTLKITLPPTGNVTLVGSSRQEVTVEARIHVEGTTPADLDELSRRVGFSLGQGQASFELVSIGPQAKLSRKEKNKAIEGLSSNLQKLPYRIDYTIQIPEYTDLDISVFEGDLNLSNTYGGIVFRVQKGNVKLTSLGGTVVGAVGIGAVRVEFQSLSWRGSGIKVLSGTGDIVLSVPRGYSADVSLTASEPLDIQYRLNLGEEVPEDTPIGNQVRARFGVGGADLTFATQKGTIRVLQYPPIR